MLARIRFLLTYYIAWIFFFELARLLFLVYHASKAAGIPASAMAASFWYGLLMDLSLSAYLLLPVCLLVLLGLWIPFFKKTFVYHLYSWLLLFPLLFIVLADLELYKSWGFRIDTTPLQYLNSPQEVWASISHQPLLRIFFGFLVLYLGLGYSFVLLIRRMAPWLRQPARPVAAAAALLFFSALLIIPLRGGFQLTPLNQSSVYFSKYNFANVTAINASWNLMHGLMNNLAAKGNPYRYLSDTRSRQLADSLYRSSGQNREVLQTSRPNVILIIWESFTEKATHASIDGVAVTPRFNELKNEGLYFSNAYASGDRTDKGIAAVLSGYPALNKQSVIRIPHKSAGLPTLSRFFREKGYTTGFYYGGEPEFANIKSYVLQGGFDELTEKSDFSRRDQNSKWGAHDGVVAARLLDELSGAKQPFFRTWLTLTSHEPFETPEAATFKGGSTAEQFQNSLHYTDEVVYRFVKDCSRQPWWSNTVLVIVADHGHPLIEPSNTVSNFRIPLLWLGGALKEKGVVIDRICSQLDIAHSLAAQAGLNNPSYFPFSRNLFDPGTHPWAYFSFNNGFGMVQPGSAYVFDNVGKTVIYTDGRVTPADVEAGKALQQQIFQDYMNR